MWSSGSIARQPESTFTTTTVRIDHSGGDDRGKMSPKKICRKLPLIGVIGLRLHLTGAPSVDDNFPIIFGTDHALEI